MLVRTQILLEAKQKLELEELARTYEMSVSEILRQSVPLVVKKIKVKKVGKKNRNSQFEALDRWIAGAVEGPGDSEYDKYAYDL